MEHCLSHYGHADSIYLKQLVLSLSREGLLLGLWGFDFERCSFWFGAMGLKIIISLSFLVGTAFATQGS